MTAVAFLLSFAMTFTARTAATATFTFTFAATTTALLRAFFVAHTDA